MNKIGIVYSTTDGQTKKISENLATALNGQNVQLALFSITEFDKAVSHFDTLVIGASIRYGKHHEKVYSFLSENQEELEKINTAFFSVNLVARKLDKDRAETNPYVKKFLDSITWKPDLVDVFAGCLDYSKYGFWDRLMIKLIMKFTQGPTSTKEPIEYTNWERVKAFAEKVSELNRTPKKAFQEKVM